MAMKTIDRYRVECQNGISEESLSSLMTFYQPLIGGDAVLLYLTLVSEARNQTKFCNLQRILTLTNIPIDTLERAMIKLEEYLLVRTFYKEDEQQNYIWVCNAPLNCMSFLQNASYMAQYQQATGQTIASESVTIQCGGSLSTQGYKDITHVMKRMRRNTAENNIQYQEVKPRYTFSVDDTTIQFDYEHFFSIVSELTFPIEARSQENLALIGKLATIYGLSPERMLLLVKDCTLLNNDGFDREKLKIKAANAKSDTKISKDPYDLPPVSFLQSKQHGAEVTFADRKLIAHLGTDMHFSNVVINIMLEYILKVSNNQLNPKFVDMVAGEWARDGIETKDQAILETQKQIKNVRSNQKHIKIEVPEYIKQQSEGTLPKSRKATEEEIQEVLELQRKVGKKQ